jgi:hypothetical protein
MLPFHALSLTLLLLACATSRVLGSPVDERVELESVNGTLAVPRIYPKDLPEMKWSVDQFERMISSMRRLESELHLAKNKNGGKVKRSTTREHWCCKVPKTPMQMASQPVIRPRVVDKVVQDSHSRPCGWFASCTQTMSRTVPVVEYYEDTEFYEVPAPEWVNGCPRDLITCCAGYLNYPPVIDNCLTPSEMTQFLEAMILGREIFGPTFVPVRSG